MALFHTAFKALGGPGDIQLDAPHDSAARQWFKQALDEIDRIERKYSRYRPDSLVSRINANAGGQPVHCDAETRALLDCADALHEHSRGCFDLTSGVWRRAWNFSDPQAPIPTARDLQPLARLVGWKLVERGPEHVRLPLRGMELDLGGLGKEYAVDRCAAVLAEAGVTHALINLAGDLRAIGAKPDGRPWQIGIAHPDRPDAVVAEIDLAQGALTTSGDYARCIWRDGRRYGHLLDARSGWPVSHWRSVSVRSASALVAGGLSTSAMLMQQEGLALLQSSGMDFLAVDALGNIHTRAGLRKAQPP